MSTALHNATYALHFYRSFLHPSPSKRAIMDHTSKLVAAIQKSLKTGTLRNNKVSLEFSSDVYSSVFQGKGLKGRNGWQLMTQQDMESCCCLPKDWHTRWDSLGDGCSIDFPLKLRWKLKWSPLHYRKLPSGNVEKKKQTFSETLDMFIVKKRV